jgi:pyridinium-3,5-biscarboxylic acid mononucleotide synthase
MTEEKLTELIRTVQSGETSLQEALQRLRTLPFEDLGFAKVDHHRSLRTGTPEVIYAAGKTPEEVARIFAAMAESGANVLATRADAEKFAAVQALVDRAHFHPRSGCITLRQDFTMRGAGPIGVLCAGTSDLPIAEEAAITAELNGNDVFLLSDVGVAGLHRLLAHREELHRARVLVVCAGMEGALPTVVAGLVSAPVVAVPTSIGYGASFNGLAALLGMLNSCAPNVAVVNIDNGFGAGCYASFINRVRSQQGS